MAEQELTEPNETQEASIKTPIKPPVTSHVALFIASLALIVAIISLVCIFFIWQFYKEMDSKLVNESFTFARKVVPTLQALTGRINQQQQTIDNLMTQFRTGERKNMIFNAEEAEHLVTLSQYNLLFDNNIPMARRLLTDADQKLQGVNDPLLDPIRKELANSIVTLDSLQKVDMTALISRIEAMSDKVKNLSPLPAVPVKAPVKPTAQMNLTWEEKLLATLSNLKGIVSIRRLQEPVKPLPSEGREAYLIETIRLHLSEAKWAVMHQNQILYQSSLEAAKKDLASFQRTDLGGNLIGMINELLQVNIKPNVPDLSKVISILRDYISNAQQTMNAANKSPIQQPVANNPISRALPS